MIFERATAEELAYGNTTGEKNPLFYATDENRDEDYNDFSCPEGCQYEFATPENTDTIPSVCLDSDGNEVKGNPESDTLKTDYYSDMDQKRLSFRSNFYYF